jgi:hypothetical protein
LDETSNILELGCGVSGLLSLVLAPRVKTYTLTDQPYVLKILKNNLTDNHLVNRKLMTGADRIFHAKSGNGLHQIGNIRIRPLDWETDAVTSLYSDIGIAGPSDQIHIIVACDCIYNESLVEPFVNTCVDICRLAPTEVSTICIVAQQLRSPDVFDAWLKAFHAHFHTWRLPERLASPDIGEDSGFVIHIGILRNS